MEKRDWREKWKLYQQKLSRNCESFNFLIESLYASGEIDWLLADDAKAQTHTHNLLLPSKQELDGDFSKCPWSANLEMSSLEIPNVSLSNFSELISSREESLQRA